MSEGIKLKPCPFCGTVPQMGVTEPTFGEPRHFVECEGIGCKVVAYTPNEYGTAQEAAEAWNRRAVESRITEIETVCAPDQMPVRAHTHDAGADLRASEGAFIGSGQFAKVSTGVRVSIPEGYVGLLAARSSLCWRGLLMANGVGIIDAGFAGEIKVPLYNAGNTPSNVLAGERIAQLVILPCELPTFRRVDELEETERGEGGFGSTGVE